MVGGERRTGVRGHSILLSGGRGGAVGATVVVDVGVVIKTSTNCEALKRQDEALAVIPEKK